MTRIRPPSAVAIRRHTEQSARRECVYVEYDDSTREYHDRTSDPYELQNALWSLTPVTRQSPGLPGWPGLLGVGTFLFHVHAKVCLEPGSR